MLWRRLGAKKGWSVGSGTVHRSPENFFRLPGSCSRFERLFQPNRCIPLLESITDRSVSPAPGEIGGILQAVWNWGQTTLGSVYTDGKMLPPPVPPTGGPRGRARTGLGQSANVLGNGRPRLQCGSSVDHAFGPVPPAPPVIFFLTYPFLRDQPMGALCLNRSRLMVLSLQEKT